MWYSVRARFFCWHVKFLMYIHVESLHCYSMWTFHKLELQKFRSKNNLRKPSFAKSVLSSVWTKACNYLDNLVEELFQPGFVLHYSSIGWQVWALIGVMVYRLINTCLIFFNWNWGNVHLTSRPHNMLGKIFLGFAYPECLPLLLKWKEVKRSFRVLCSTSSINMRYSLWKH